MHPSASGTFISNIETESKDSHNKTCAIGDIEYNAPDLSTLHQLHAGPTCSGIFFSPSTGLQMEIKTS